LLARNYKSQIKSLNGSSCFIFLQLCCFEEVMQVTLSLLGLVLDTFASQKLELTWCKTRNTLIDVKTIFGYFTFYTFKEGGYFLKVGSNIGSCKKRFCYIHFLFTEIKRLSTNSK